MIAPGSEWFRGNSKTNLYKETSHKERDMKKILIAMIMFATMIMGADIQLSGTGNTANTKITSISLYEAYPDHVFIKLSVRNSDYSTSSAHDYVFDASTSFGKRLYATLLSAYNNQQDIGRIYGTASGKNLGGGFFVEYLKRVDL